MANARQFTGWHVLWIGVGGIGTVVAVNMYFVFAALSSHSGVDVGDAYTLGLAYNSQLEERARQASQGWSAELSSQPGENGALQISIIISDESGAPLTGLSVSGELRRVVESRSDQVVMLQETLPGQYRATVALPYAGRWQGRFTVMDDGERRLAFEGHLWVE